MERTKVMDETGKEDTRPVKRLCSEIQLFDLCELDACGYREGRFCTNRDLLDRFEGIAEDDKTAAVRYPAGEPDDAEEDDEPGYGDAFGDDEFDDEGSDWEDE